MAEQFIDTPIVYLKGVGPQRAELLQKELQIFTFGDLLNYFPFRYVDKGTYVKIRDINNDTTYILLKGVIRSIEQVGKLHASRLVARFEDGSGEMELIWFQGIKWVKEKLIIGQTYVVFGRPTLFNSKYNIAHPDFEPFTEEHNAASGTLMPFYNTTEKLKNKGLNSKVIAKLTQNLINQILDNIPETLPDYLIDKFKLLGRETALKQIHLPDNQQLLARAQSRLKFEELFFLQLKYQYQKNSRKEKITGCLFSKVGHYFNTFYFEKLPFQLTGAQQRVMKEIRKDLGSGKQMNRLLQGDVGSGKTLVGLMSMLLAIDNGYQACMMAPTEILAAQHYKSLTKITHGLGINIRLLMGSTRKAERTKITEGLQDGSIHIVVGTHALIEDYVQFQKLGLVIIDEQHRFGVAQRAKLWEKANPIPHVLVMTATPIPRTLAMTVYGDLDTSVIDELPPGRKPITTLHKTDSARLWVFGFMRQQIKAGRQVYVVYPLIHESETLDLKHLMDGYESISRDFPLPEYAISIVHGKMKAADKEFEMQRFVKGETQIMVSTTVIEVGVDVPNASVMVIENAERFGLAQLHQLRGRVGRGADQSYCVLITGYKLTNDARLRIDTMVRTNDGFEIAEADLKLRGPGDLEGTQQSGILDLKIADLVKDENIIRIARDTAEAILSQDALLQKKENIRLFVYIRKNVDSTLNWGQIS